MPELDELQKQQVDALVQKFYFISMTRSPQQHSMLIETFSNIVYFLGYERKYASDLAFIRKNPAKFFVLNNQDWFSKKELRNLDTSYHLDELDYLYHRDTSVGMKFSKCYQSLDNSRSNRNKKLYLNQINSVMAFMRQWLNIELAKIIKEFKLKVPTMDIILPEDRKHNLMEGVQLGKK